LKILLVGLGSIGKRHLRNIIGIGYNEVDAVSRSGILPDEFAHLQVYKTIEEAITQNSYGAAVICVPTAQHIDAFRQLVQAKIQLIYLEKPVSHDYAGIDDIVELLEKNGNKVVVGFDMHYDLGLLKVKQLLDSGTIGNLLSANAQVGQYLPDWRPHEDYSKGMSAKKQTGGGVMLDLVHEFDYLYWLIGEARTIASFNKNSGALQIETEDIAEVMLRFKNGVLGTIHLDYLQQKLVRNCLFTGSDGSITWNLAESKVSWINKNKEEQVFTYKDYERNDRFIGIMKAFLNNENDTRLTSFQHGLASLRMVLAAKYSSEHNVFVQMENFNP
jgi:predicted dehydrogenase